MRAPMFQGVPPELHIAALGVLCIFLLEGYALYQGVNGIMFGTAMGGIGSIVGWVFKGYQVRSRGRSD